MIRCSQFLGRGHIFCPLTALLSLIFLFIPFCQAALPNKYSLLRPDDIKVSTLDPSRVRRSVYGSKVKNTPGPTKHIAFNALNRRFNLAIWPDDITQKHPDMVIDISGIQRVTPKNLTSVFFSGVDTLEPESSSVNVYVDVTGLMTGSIHYDSNIDDVYLEPGWRHNLDKDSILVYNESNSTGNRDTDVFPFEGFSHKCMEDNTAAINNSKSTSEYKAQQTRNRRGSSDDVSDGFTNMRCSLLLVADHKFFQRMGNSNWESTASYLIGLIDRVNEIYLNTDFSISNDPILGSKTITQIGFQIKHILIHPVPSPYPWHYNSAVQWKVQELLIAFSSSGEGSGKSFHHASYCLCHLFTYEDLEEGVMGMAYRAEENLNHGVCSGAARPKYVHATSSDGGNYGTASRNTGITTMFNWGSAVLTQAADLVTGHELGHNFGSNHDPPECVPSVSQGGSYLMLSRAVSGKQPNNRHFSPCSREGIGRILAQRIPVCFVPAPSGDDGSPSKRGYCGDAKVDPGEDCDEGVIFIKDSGSNSTGGRKCCGHDCKFIGGAECSDFNHRCCNGCSFEKKGQVCDSAHPLSCSYSSFCSGRSGNCPPGKPKPNQAKCFNHGQCRRGQCISHCEAKGESTCECESLENVLQAFSKMYPGKEVIATQLTSLHDGSDVIGGSGGTSTQLNLGQISPECVLCCQRSFNSTDDVCYPVHEELVADKQFYGWEIFIYPDHTFCTGGTCQRGQCISNLHNDILSYFLSAFKGRNFWQITYKLIAQNVVMAVTIISLIIYVPCCLLLHFCIDREILSRNKQATETFIGNRVLAEHPRLNPPKSPSPLSETASSVFFNRLPSCSQSIDGWQISRIENSNDTLMPDSFDTSHVNC